MSTILSLLLSAAAAWSVSGSSVDVAHSSALRATGRSNEADDPFAKVKDMITHRIAVMKADLAEDEGEAGFCKKQLTESKARLEEQGKVVQEKIQILEEAKAAAGKKLQDKLNDANWQREKAEMALKSAQQAADGPTEPYGPTHAMVQRKRKLQVQRKVLEDIDNPQEAEFDAMEESAAQGGAPAPAAAESSEDLQKAVEMAKYDLKQELKELENTNKEHDILHERCISNAGQTMTYAERKEARKHEIESLNSAYDMLGNQD